MNHSEMAIEILRRTNDGDDLSPRHLYLLECAVNVILNDHGATCFEELHTHVMAGTYTPPWFHDIEHLTIDHHGWVSWKGERVEHYNPGWAYSEDASQAARSLAETCRKLEENGQQPNLSTVWNAHDITESS